MEELPSVQTCHGEEVQGHKLFQHNSWPARRNCCLVLGTSVSPAAEIQFCFLLSALVGMWTFWSWTWEEWCMSEKSVPYYRRPYLSSASIAKCSNHCAVMWNLCLSAVNRSDLLHALHFRFLEGQKWLPEWLGEDKKCGVCLSQQKVSENEGTVCRLVEGANVSEKRAHLPVEQYWS